MKTKEIVYIIMDLLKNSSEDAYFTEDHILFLLKHHRALILKQEQERKKFIDSVFNTQTICLDMTPFQQGDCGDVLLKSAQKIPTTISTSNPVISLMDYYGDYRISFVSSVKMKYIGENKFMKNIIYCSIGPDKHLYMKSNNPQFINLENVTFQSVFDDVEEADSLSCDTNNDNDEESCGLFDKEFPIDSYLVPQLIQSVLQVLLGAQYRPQDKYNDANDLTSQIELFLRNNIKSPLIKQIEGNE